MAVQMYEHHALAIDEAGRRAREELTHLLLCFSASIR